MRETLAGHVAAHLSASAVSSRDESSPLDRMAHSLLRLALRLPRRLLCLSSTADQPSLLFCLRIAERPRAPRAGSRAIDCPARSACGLWA